ncbi:AAA family ATPase [Leptothoe kymatousa]|uniref:histidine kinase n=1 Tax=Leptothoe kymatousa TAU-MAC 1615 TaxID=2364775 RepID=A0ABS5Y4D2_9CYAN|nr:AAA family ATPase [Leptothoe kymatousa]MBT9312692.1 AAA family ATPase [Leptothoe kymatousa TAU-MAC 1615]
MSSITDQPLPFLSGYTLTETLYQGSRTLVYRAVAADGQSVVIKLLRSPQPSFSELLHFRNQFTIANNLPIAGIVKPLALKPWHRGYALVMEDVGGVSLKEYGQNYAPLSVAQRLSIGLQLATILHGLGQHRVVHKDINPANILIHPHTHQIWLTDFGLASLLPKESQDLQSPHSLEGTLAYIAPEQTGRMNRGIDYRVDFYGLGVTLYELFSGVLPFQVEDPMELIHSHLAKPPAPLHHLNPQLPPQLSAIVLKLMAKNAEDRYQSALGLLHDWQTCGEQWQTTGTIAEFEVGTKDRCDRFLIPEKLYGRSADVQVLMAAFERVTQGSAELLTVTGYSGVGKTAVVNEIHKPITQQRGYFIEGKFDQFNRNIPFSAFVQAFRGLVGQLLGESDHTLATWKDKILHAVGINGQVLLDVIPELECIIGPQPPAPHLSGRAAQNRFNLVFERFVQLFATAEHPLVIFLDDLQWADLASLNLLQLLVAKANLTTEYLLVIGAYRDNEVLAGHPLQLALNEMAQQQAPVQPLTLTPLSPHHINQLVADTLLCTPTITEPLTQFVYQKAQGNPFFTIQFLTGLHNDGYVTFNANQGHWQCDLTQVQQLALTDDVVGYMVERLQTLPTATQRVLQIAACIGNQFDLSTLAVVCGNSQEQSALELWQVLQAGLIIPESNTYRFFQGKANADRPAANGAESGAENLSQNSVVQQSGADSFSQNSVVQQSGADSFSQNSVAQLRGTDSFSKNSFAQPQKTTGLSDFTIPYRFLHDRVQQAAYHLISDQQTQQIHLEIGRRWLHGTPLALRAERLFDIVGQLNLGRRLVVDAAERQTLIQLNLQAAKQALSNTAYGTANDCLQVCRELLSAHSWQTHYGLTLDIYNISVETAYLQGKWAEIDAFTQLIEQRAKETLDVAKAYEFKVESRTIQGKFPEAMTLGLQILESLEVTFPHQPTENDIKAYLHETRRLLARRSAQDVLRLPLSSSAYTQAILCLLIKVGASAYTKTPNLYVLIGLKMVQLSLIHGNTPESIFGYSRYGILNCNLLGDVETGYQFGQASLELREHFDTIVHDSHIIWVLNTLLFHWKQPVETTLAPLQQAYAVGLETGDLVYVGYSACSYCTHAYLAGHRLAPLDSEIQQFNQGLARIRQDVALSYNRMLHQVVLSLMNPAFDVSQGMQALDTTVDIAQLEKKQDLLGLWGFYVNKSVVCYLFQAYDEAWHCQQQAYQLARIGIGTIYTSLLFWTGALTCLALLLESPRAASIDIAQLEHWVAVGKEKLQLWATHNPHYYQHKCDLLWAESHRLDGDRLAALEAYDRAIAGAKAHGYLQDEALANELAGKFYLAWGKEKIAAPYLQAAYTCYGEWGAHAKTSDLEQRYPQLIQSSRVVINPLETLANLVSPQVSNYSSRVASGIPDGLNQAFDFSSVLKAAQTLTETIQLDDLLEKLSHVILQNSGGDRLILALPNGEDHWDIRLVATPDTVDIYKAQEPSQINAPSKLINYVKNTRELIYSDQLDHTFPMVDAYLINRSPKSFLCAPLVTQDQLTGVLYLDSSNNRGLISSARIITLNFLFSQVAIGLKNAQVLEQSLALKSKVIESSIDGIAILENDILIYLNQAFADLFGYLPEELLNTNWGNLHPSEEETRLIETAISECMGTGSWSGEFTAIRKDGSLFFKESRLFRLDDGKVICICRDISDRKKLEQEQERLIQILQATPDFVGICRPPQGVILWQNQPFRNLRPDLKIFEEEVQISHLYPQWAYDLVRAEGLPAAIQHGTWRGETALLTQTGEEIPTSQVIIAHKSDNGDVKYFSTILRDISDRKASDQALHDSQARFRRITENVPGMIYRYVLHPDGSCGLSYVSSQVRDIYELEPDVVLQDISHLQERIHPDDRMHTQAISAESARTLQPLKVEHRLMLPEKGLRWIQAIARPELLDNGAIIWDGLTLDITDRKAAEQALEESQAQFKRITENIPGMIYRCVLHLDGSCHILYASSQIQEIFELEPQAIINGSDHPLWARTHPDDIPQVRAAMQRSAENLSPLISEHRLILPQKGLRWIQQIARPGQLENGDVVWDGVVIDISDRRQAEEKIRQTMAQLEASNNELESFAYSISHDLRAPLRAINGFSQALLEDYGPLFDDIAQDYFNRIQTNATRMGTLIDDLLQLSRLSRSELSYTTFDLSAFAQEALHDLQASDPDRQVDIVITPGLTVLADASLMQVVLMNLLQNAWKFTSHHATARIEFGVLPPQLPDCPNAVYFVKDDGAGFDMTYSHKLFGVFQRLHSVKEFSGTGIGLASVRRAIHRHGGQIWAEAAVEMGATFFFNVRQN